MAIQPPTQPPSERPLPRVINVALAIVLGLAVVGYLIGTRPASRPDVSTAPSAAASDPHAVPGQTYLELRMRQYGPNAKVRSDLGDLRSALPAVSAPVHRTAEQHLEAHATRIALRAYDGAPPVVPHPIDEQSAASCLGCHKEGVVVEGRVARAISHPPYASCTQCHVTAEPRFEKPPPPHNTFAGHHPNKESEQAWPGAPPVIPHSVWMRDNCSSCHGVAGLPGLRTTHPDRPNCTQCHAAYEDRTRPWAAR